MVQLWDAGLDWLTMTWKDGDPQREIVREVIDSEMFKSESKEEPMIPLKHSNYVGWEQGTLKMGVREDSMLVQCTGGRARIIGEVFRDHGISGNATRIDFQATAQIQEKSKIYLADIETKVRAACGEAAGRKAKNTAGYQNRGRSSGMVIGHRTSTSYSRIYDKTLESHNRLPQGLIRFEHEAKGKRARTLWQIYRKSAQPYYVSLSVAKSEFEPMGCDMSFLNGGEHIEHPSEYVPTSGRKKMEWFATHVKKSVAYCVELYGRDEVLKALGLD